MSTSFKLPNSGQFAMQQERTNSLSIRAEWGKGTDFNQVTTFIYAQYFATVHYYLYDTAYIQLILLFNFICLTAVVYNFHNHLKVIVKALLLSFVFVILKASFGTTELKLKKSFNFAF